MKRYLLLLGLVGAAAYASVALATPGQGQSPTVLSSGALNGDVAFYTGGATTDGGIQWGSRKYTGNQLPEFLMGLRNEGVTSVGGWLDMHPAVASKFGMMPVGLLHSPEIVTQTVKFAPGAFSGWHSHPGFLVSTVVSGQLTRYATDCSVQTYGPGQSFYETGSSTFIVKNETNAEAVDTVTFVVPGGTPSSGLRLDKTQPTTCNK
jgi:quercetin dioxygenase-like cupin family protein